MIDVEIYESGSGGEFNLVNDDLETINGLTNQVYLALFGGNVEQSTSDDLNNLDQRFDWWGNGFLENENQFNSTFEKILSEVALNSSGLSKLKSAAKEDLKYLEDYADITINASITGLNRLELLINLDEPGNISTKIKFVWEGTKNELIQEITI